MSVRATPAGRRFLAILLAVPIAFSVLFFVANTIAEHIDTRRLNLEILSSQFARLRSVANDAEIGEHGFLLTGDDKYRGTLDSATHLLSEQQNIDFSQIPDDLRVHYLRFLNLVRTRVDMANRVLQVQQQASWGAALDAVRTRESQKVMEQMRGEAEWLEKELHQENQERYEQYHRLTTAGFLLFLFGTMTMLIVMVWFYNQFFEHLQDRDEAYAQLQRLNADLEARIAERTRELQEFNEELQQFAYVASHDLQEPLRTITSFSQLLSTRYKGKLDADGDEFVDYIVNSARRMTDLINGLLALVRLRKSGHQMTVVPIESLVHQAEISLQAAIRESNATIETSNLPYLMVDPVQFTQVIQNLIANAIKYRREEQPLIRVTGRRDATNWILSVEDNGRGFDPQFAERIFGLFQRLESREVDGTGMGLTIVRRIVERHGGRVWAESEEGRGSIFHISLPGSLEAHPAQVESEEPAGAPLNR